MGRLQTERFRAFHRSRGEAYRWFKAFKVENPRTTASAERDGSIYVEQEVDAQWKALVHETVRDFEDAQFGLVPKGTASISVMPDETYLARNDRIILPERRLLSRALVKRGSEEADALVFRPVASIVTVRKETTVYTAGTHYQLSGDGIEWLGDAGPVAGEKYMVEYFYYPTYVFIGEDNAPRPGNAGLMPQRGAMLLVHPKD